MENVIIAEGKTTNEAIENGLKKLNVSRNMVNIKVLENEEKRSFFSILEPRVVKVELTLKENNFKKNTDRKVVFLSDDEQNKAKENVETFLKEFFKKLNIDVNTEITTTKDFINVNIKNENLGFLIGYRGETLYAMQNIISTIAGKGIDKRVKVVLDIEEYKEKREKTLKDLAEKIAKAVIKTKKSVTLEPMQAYERKIIHTELQDNKYVTTRSIGEEPHRKVVIELKNN